MARRIDVETWDVEYGSPLAETLDPSGATVDASVELPVERWRALGVPEGVRPAREVVFVDGVRRVEAIAWITGDDGSVRRGLCASLAAGVVRAGERARIERVEVRRILLARGPVEALMTRAGAYLPEAAAGDDPDRLALALQQRLGELEISVATALDDASDLVVVDGPLSGRQNVPGAVGYVKTHHVSYLPDELERVVASLEPGERTPLFVTQTSWTRYSWYLRLPGAARHPWAGVVRLEASANRPVREAAALADLAAATLPTYASVPHKDPRAPQNLFPIGGLERELRRRLGDAALVQRALRSAAAGALRPSPPGT